jgi:hypothetical protein
MIDEDCGWGIDEDTGRCFTANKDHIDTDPAEACPDFCGGIAGFSRPACINNVCSAVNISK